MTINWSPDGTSFTIRRPSNFHVHVRSGPLLRDVLPSTTRVYAYAGCMGNTLPPVDTAARYRAYQAELAEGTPPEHVWARPLAFMKLTRNTTPDEILTARSAGCVAAKLYFAGTTTNAGDGFPTFASAHSRFEAMQDCGMVLCVHAELPESEGRDAESDCIPYLYRLLEKFPQLKVVIEHATDYRTVRAFREWKHPNLGITVTPHHLVLTQDDVTRGKLRPHNFCMPLAKWRQDRDALLELVMLGLPNVFLGDDSAPHVVRTKECAEGCAGVYNAPVSFPLYVRAFEEYGKLESLETFASVNGPAFYGLPSPADEITVRREPWNVPHVCGHHEAIVPFRAGEKEGWQVAP